MLISLPIFIKIHTEIRKLVSKATSPLKRNLNVRSNNPKWHTRYARCPIVGHPGFNFDHLRSFNLPLNVSKSAFLPSYHTGMWPPWPRNQTHNLCSAGEHKQPSQRRLCVRLHLHTRSDHSIHNNKGSRHFPYSPECHSR